MKYLAHAPAEATMPQGSGVGWLERKARLRARMFLPLSAIGFYFFFLYLISGDCRKFSTPFRKLPKIFDPLPKTPENLRPPSEKYQHFFKK